jgi:hypothetical protein
MATYRIKFRFRGSMYEEEVTCFGATAARQAILAQYPGATIYNIAQVR